MPDPQKIEAKIVLMSGIWCLYVYSEAAIPTTPMHIERPSTKFESDVKNGADDGGK